MMRRVRNLSLLFFAAAAITAVTAQARVLDCLDVSGLS